MRVSRIFRIDPSKPEASPSNGSLSVKPLNNSITRFMPISCKQFTDFLIRRVEHLDNELIRDITPVQGWIGHVSTGNFPAGEGVSHTFDRINRVYPDLSGCWQDRVVGSCIGTPCDPTEKKIGFGSTRDSYILQDRSYATDLFCFDLAMTADRAKEQFAGLVETLRDATSIIQSDRFRLQALIGAGKKVLSAPVDGVIPDFTFTLSDDCTILTPSAFPTSILTNETLQRQLEPLKLNGYFGKVPDMPPMAELVTDMTTAYNLVQGNPVANQLFRFSDFVQGGSLYKYGIVNAVGNYGIRNDDHQLRFQRVGNTLQRVFPYVNVAATQGIKGIVNQAYVEAHYAVDFIWNRMAMQALTLTPESINPMMPFAKRDFAGKWQFVMDNLGADANGCVIDNKRRNKGQFIADFSNAIKWLRPEWVVAILSLRQIACVENLDSCQDDPGYVYQNYSSANDLCPEQTLSFTITATAPLEVNQVTCNGVPIAQSPSGSLANVAAVVTWLNANMGSLGTWAQVGATNEITLSGTTCSDVGLTVETFTA